MTKTRFSRRQSLKIGILGGAGALLLPKFGLAAMNWDMPVAYSAGNFVTKAYMAFAEEVKARTNGELAITVHAGGSLYDGSEIMRAVREGQVPIGARFLAAHAAEAAVFGVDTIPFLATTREQSWKLYEVSRPLIEQTLEVRGMKFLFAPVWPPQGLFSKREVNSIEDMRGVKFRAYDASTSRLAELMGAIPTKTEASEIAQAFSTGVAEAMIASGAIGVFQKIWDYCEYFYTVNAWLPKSAVIVNVQAWEGLDEATRSVLLEVSATTEAAVWDQMESENEGYLQAMKDNGMTVAEPSEQLKADLEAIGAKMVDEWIASVGESGARLIADYRAALQ